jgi:hypothetical protein
MTPVEWGVILIVAAVMLFVVGWLPTIRSIMIFVGILAVGFGGHLTHLLSGVMVFLAGLTGQVTAWAFGVAVPAVLAVALIIFVIHEWHPKNKAGRGATIAAAALALLILGGASLGIFANLPARVQQGVSTTTTQVGG